MNYNIIVWDRFAGKLLDYIYETKPTGLRVNWYLNLVESANINTMPDDLKRVAKKYLPLYLREYPDDKKAECIKINQ